MSIDVSRVLRSPRMKSEYIITRFSDGHWTAGEFYQTPTSIPTSGIVIPYKSDKAEYTSTGDLISGEMVFYNEQRLYVTRNNSTDGTGTSDELTWKNQVFKINHVDQRSEIGNYYRAIAARKNNV